MKLKHKTVIITGASQGIGAGLVETFLVRGYDVVGTARNATKSKELPASDHLALTLLTLSSDPKYSLATARQFSAARRAALRPVSTSSVRLGVSVATSGDVRDQPKVADAASDLLEKIFGKD